MKFKAFFLLTISLILANTLFAQATTPTVETIIQNYIKAVGGKAAIEKQTVRQMKGTVELAPIGLKGTVEMLSVAPNKSYSKSNITGIGEIIEGFDGKTAWSINPLQGSREKKGEELLQIQLLNDFYRDLNLEKLYPKMEVKGVEKIGDKEAYVVIATPTGLAPDTFYFDKQTGLLLRQDTVYISPEGKFNLQTTFEDYRDVDGIQVAFKMMAKNPQFEVITTFTEVKHGVKVEESLFAKPN